PHPQTVQAYLGEYDRARASCCTVHLPPMRQVLPCHCLCTALDAQAWCIGVALDACPQGGYAMAWNTGSPCFRPVFSCRDVPSCVRRSLADLGEPCAELLLKA